MSNGGRYVVANLLVGADGSTTVHGRSVGLSSPTDRKRFHQLRATADFIVIGGNTARNEPYASTPVPLVVITHGPLPDEVSSNSMARAVNSELPAVLNLLEGNILIEAGPALLSEAMSLRLVDELHLTVTTARPNENKVDIENLLAGYIEESVEEFDGEKFFTFIPTR